MSIPGRTRRPAFLALGFLFLAAACATVTADPRPLASPPNLVGRWLGEWGGNMPHAMEMVVERQDGSIVSGKMIFPRATPALSGSVGAKDDGSVWVRLHAGESDFLLRVVSDRRLEGTGQSAHHFGPVTLNRQ